MLNGWMWVCVPLSSSLPLVSVCVCVYNDVRQRGGESTAQHKWLHHSLLSLFLPQALLSFCFLIFSASLALLFVLFSTLLTRCSSPSLSALSPSSPCSPPSVFVFISLCCHTLSHQSLWISVQMLHSEATHVVGLWCSKCYLLLWLQGTCLMCLINSPLTHNTTTYRWRATHGRSPWLTTQLKEQWLFTILNIKVIY